jgi:hypothetical protein
MHMRISRRISLSAHGAIESLAGIVIMLSPIALPVGAAGLVVLAVAGAIVTGAGLGLISTSPRVGVLPSARASAHTGLDGVLVVASALGALALALAGEAPAALALAALVVVQACLSFVTSYATAS